MSLHNKQLGVNRNVRKKKEAGKGERKGGRKKRGWEDRGMELDFLWGCLSLLGRCVVDGAFAERELVENCEGKERIKELQPGFMHWMTFNVLELRQG